MCRGRNFDNRQSRGGTEWHIGDKENGVDKVTTNDGRLDDGRLDDGRTDDGRTSQYAAVQDTSPNEHQRFHCVMSTPIGRLLIVATAVAVAGVYHEEHNPRPAPTLLGELAVLPRPQDGADGAHDAGKGGPRSAPKKGLCSAPSSTIELLSAASQEMSEYFQGLRRQFDVATDSGGTLFQRRVWSALAQIPYGERRSYRDVATALGNPSMGRAIGAAVRTNPLSIIVPGHRVVSSTGAVVGYAAGIGVKTALLELEQKFASA